MKSRGNICGQPGKKKGGQPFFRGRNVQYKTNISPANNESEKQANEVSEGVMSANSTNAVFFRPKFPGGGAVQNEHSSTENNGVINKTIQWVTHSPGQPMDKDTRLFMENRLGYDFTEVQIHNDDVAHRSVIEANALAYTYGNHIAFGKNQYLSNTHEGKKLLAHELTHVVQQRNAGNKTIQRKVTCVKKGPQTMAKAQVEACLKALVVSDAKSIRTTLICLGIEEAMLGNLDTLTAGVVDTDAEKKRVGSAMSPAEITAAFELLGKMVPGSNGRVVFGECNRIISAWNVNKDDLGPSSVAKRGRYPTILHYMRELIFLGSSGTTTINASAYEDFTKNVPAIFLAGAESGIMNVHPRNIYFVAAAQVSMDKMAGLEETFEISGTTANLARLHYIAPAGFPKQIILLGKELKKINKIKRGKTVPDDWALKFNRVVLVLAQFLESIRKQLDIENTSTIGDEESHSEKKFLEWVKANLSFFDSLEVIELSDKDKVPGAAQQLLDVLNTIPKGKDLAHGFGALDPHGTDHALGFAIDLFNARSGEHNAAFKHPEYVPFLNYLMDNFTHEYTLDGELRNINFVGTRITHIDQLPAESARDFSILLQEKGIEAYESILQDDTTEKIDPKAVRADNAVIALIRKKYRGLKGILDKMLDRTHKEFRNDKELVNRINAFKKRFAYHSLLLDKIDPELVATFLQNDIDELSEIAISSLNLMVLDNGTSLSEGIPEKEKELEKYQGRTLSRKEKAEKRKLVSKLTKARSEEKRKATIIYELDVIGDFGEDPVQLSPLDEAMTALEDGIAAGLQERYFQRQHAHLLKIVKPKSFKKWLDNIIKMGVYTQPPMMVNAINSVRSFPNQEKLDPGTEFQRSHFQAGHHWQVAPREIITNDSAYTKALLRDMKHRDTETLKRIIRTINEWPKAKGILAIDKVFISALGSSILHERGEDDLMAGQRLIKISLDENKGAMAP